MKYETRVTQPGNLERRSEPARPAAAPKPIAKPSQGQQSNGTSKKTGK